MGSRQSTRERQNGSPGISGRAQVYLPSKQPLRPGDLGFKSRLELRSIYLVALKPLPSTHQTQTLDLPLAPVLKLPPYQEQFHCWQWSQPNPPLDYRSGSLACSLQSACSILGSSRVGQEYRLTAVDLSDPGTWETKMRVNSGHQAQGGNDWLRLSHPIRNCDLYNLSVLDQDYSTSEELCVLGDD